MLACLPLLEVLTHAEDHSQTCLKGELGLDNELLIGLTVVLAALGVSEDHPLAAYCGKHISRHLSGVSTLHVVGAVLGGKLNPASSEGLVNAAEMGKRRSHDEAHTLRHACRKGGHFLCEFYSFRLHCVHLPVACNDFLSHVLYLLIF